METFGVPLVGWYDRVYFYTSKKIFLQAQSTMSRDLMEFTYQFDPYHTQFIISVFVSDVKDVFLNWRLKR